MIVPDAGAFLEVLLDSAAGRVVQTAAETEGMSAPDLFDAEVLHRLLVLEKHGHLSARRVDAAIARLQTVPMQRLAHGPLLSLARRLGAALSGYDALYAAAAITHDRRLVTTDLRLARTATEQFGLAVTTVPTSGR